MKDAETECEEMLRFFSPEAKRRRIIASVIAIVVGAGLILSGIWIAPQSITIPLRCFFGGGLIILSLIVLYNEALNSATDIV